MTDLLALIGLGIKALYFGTPPKSDEESVTREQLARITLQEIKITIRITRPPMLLRISLRR